MKIKETKRSEEETRKTEECKKVIFTVSKQSCCTISSFNFFPGFRNLEKSAEWQTEENLRNENKKRNRKVVSRKRTKSKRNGCTKGISSLVLFKFMKIVWSYSLLFLAFFQQNLLFLIVPTIHLISWLLFNGFPNIQIWIT